MMEKVENAANFLQNRFGEAPTTVVILGSGLSGFANTLSSWEAVTTGEIPGAAKSTVVGHDGRVVIGELKNGNRVGVLAGRVHGYEGHAPNQVVLLPRALRHWGVENFIITNAAGSTRTTFKPATLAIIKDQINLTGQNPLTGTELYGGPRFPDMTDLYNLSMRKIAKGVAAKLNISMKEGVYTGLMGPTYETAAEIKMFAKLGADLVGMSTVWESIAVHQMGAKVLGISCVTNFGTGISKHPLSHQEVLESTEKVQKTFNRFMTELLQKLE